MHKTENRTRFGTLQSIFGIIYDIQHFTTIKISSFERKPLNTHKFWKKVNKEAEITQITNRNRRSQQKPKTGIKYL